MKVCGFICKTLVFFISIYLSLGRWYSKWLEFYLICHLTNRKCVYPYPHLFYCSFHVVLLFCKCIFVLGFILLFSKIFGILWRLSNCSIAVWWGFILLSFCASVKISFCSVWRKFWCLLDLCVASSCSWGEEILIKGVYLHVSLWEIGGFILFI